jgi:hypothetical protein
MHRARPSEGSLVLVVL